MHYTTLRNAVNKLATVDCLLSMAEIASQGDYVKPIFVREGQDVLEITDGRHPAVELLRFEPFVPNSICIGGNEERTKIITGPNMGGKSSTVRMVALIALLAQIGSYVPAASVRLSPLDAILTRMGGKSWKLRHTYVTDQSPIASDDLARGRSTFMVEMSETSDILASATQKSLVILDELGRGSSTFDGVSVNPRPNFCISLKDQSTDGHSRRNPRTPGQKCSEQNTFYHTLHCNSAFSREAVSRPGDQLSHGVS